MQTMVRLFSKDRPQAEQFPPRVLIEIPHDAYEFEHAGKCYKIISRETTPVHQHDKPRPRGADAVEC